MNNAKADGVSYNGIYTGKTYQGIPEGEGTLLVDTSLYFKAYEELVTMQEHLRTSYKRPSKLTIDGTWYEGQLVDGEIKATDTSRVFGTKMQASKFIKDNRPFGDTTRQVSLLQEVRTLKDESRNIQGGSLVDKIYVENAESAISWTGLTATMNLHGKIRWTTRPTAHKFAWASDVEDLRMSDGKGTLTVNFDYHEYTNNPVLTGRAMVTLFPRKSLHAQAHGKDGVLEKANHRYDRGIVLVGNMVQNRLEGVVLAAVPIPGVRFPDNDFRFFIKGYDSDGAPIVRLLTPIEKDANPVPRMPQEDLSWYTDRELDEARHYGWYNNQYYWDFVAPSAFLAAFLWWFMESETVFRWFQRRGYFKDG